MPQGVGSCPLTKRSVARRDLVILTPDNIEQHRGRIVNWD